MAQEPKRRGEPLPLPPTPPARTAPRRMPRGKTEDEILNERRPMDPLARLPFQRSNDTDYVVGSEDMMAPRNFEYMNRAREKQKEPTRLKKGGPVKKYADGGKVENYGEFSRPMREYDETVPKRRSQGMRSAQASQGREKEAEDTASRYRGMRSTTRTLDELLPRRRGALENESLRRNMMSPPIGESPSFEPPSPRRVIKADGTEEIQNLKKGGQVKKMAKGGVTNKKFIQQAIKKPGALRAQLGVKAGQNIPAKKLATAAKAPGKLGQRARFAQTLSKMKGK